MLIWHIHLTILSPLQSILITSSSLTGHISPQYSTIFHTHVEYNLCLIPNLQGLTKALNICTFLTAIWLSHGQLWAIL